MNSPTLCFTPSSFLPLFKSTIYYYSLIYQGCTGFAGYPGVFDTGYPALIYDHRISGNGRLSGRIFDQICTKYT